MINLAYLNYCSMWVVTIAVNLEPYAQPTNADIIKTLLFGIFLIFYPLFCLIVVMRAPNEKLQQKETRDKYKNIYPNVNVWSSDTDKKIYYFMLLMFRLTFMVTPWMMKGWPYP